MIALSVIISLIPSLTILFDCDTVRLKVSTDVLRESTVVAVTVTSCEAGVAAMLNVRGNVIWTVDPAKGKYG